MGIYRQIPDEDRINPREQKPPYITYPQDVIPLILLKRLREGNRMTTPEDVVPHLEALQEYEQEGQRMLELIPKLQVVHQFRAYSPAANHYFRRFLNDLQYAFDYTPDQFILTDKGIEYCKERTLECWKEHYRRTMAVTEVIGTTIEDLIPEHFPHISGDD